MLASMSTTMAIHCNSDIRFFLHTFIFVNNTSSSVPSALTSSKYYPANGNNSFADWLQGGNSTDTAGRNADLQEVLECLQMYIVPVLISLGVGGSALGLAVLLATFLRFKFFTHFLVCLNVSSAAFLLTVFVSWLADNGVDVFRIPGLCQMHVFSSHFFTFLTVWHSVLGAYLVLYDWLKPGAVPWLHSPTAAKTAVLGLSVLGFTMYSYKTWTHFTMVHRGSRVCTVIPENQAAMEILNIVDVLVLLVFPSFLHLLFVLLVFLTRLQPHCRCLTCLNSWPMRAKGRERVLNASPGDVLVEVDFPATRCSKKPRCREVHRLVLSQSVCFLLLVAPRAGSTMFVLVHRWVYQQIQTSDDILLQHVFQFSFYFYFTLLPYCPALTSSKFRLHCCSLFRASNHRRPRPSERGTTTTNRQPQQRQLQHQQQ